MIYISGNHGKHNIGINNPILLEAGMVGDAGKRVLLMPYKTDWPTNDGTVIWECFTDGVEQDRCYPKFTKPVKDWKKIGSW